MSAPCRETDFLPNEAVLARAETVWAAGPESPSVTDTETSPPELPSWKEGSPAQASDGGVRSILTVTPGGGSAVPVAFSLAAYSVCVPSVDTAAPAPVYKQPAGIVANVLGALAGSSTQLVAVTEENGSLADTDTVTGTVYHPAEPFGLAGERAI